MKKVLLSIILMASAQLLQATVWTVSFDTRPAQFANLQTAIDSASAGDTVLINGYQSGWDPTYLRKPLVLMGESSMNPAINPTITPPIHILELEYTIWSSAV